MSIPWRQSSKSATALELEVPWRAADPVTLHD